MGAEVFPVQSKLNLAKESEERFAVPQCRGLSDMV